MTYELRLRNLRHRLAMVTQQIRQASLGVRKLTPQEWKQYGDAWLVTEGETWVGLITKAKSTKLDLYPWKVFKYTQGPDAPGGAKTRYMGALYDRDREDWSQVLLRPQEAIQQLVGFLGGRIPTKGRWNPALSGEEMRETKRQRRPSKRLSPLGDQT